MSKLGVRDLAEYAANPAEFLSRNGRVTNKKAVKKGNERHDAIGSRRFHFAWFFVIVIVATYFYIA